MDRVQYYASRVLVALRNVSGANGRTTGGVRPENNDTRTVKALFSVGWLECTGKCMHPVSSKACK